MDNTSEKNVSTNQPDSIGSIPRNRETSLEHLGKTIKRSTSYFIVATILLVVAFVLVINRQQAISSVNNQISNIDDFHINILEMREAEKNYRLEAGETYVLQYQTQYQKAFDTLTHISESSTLAPEDAKVITRLKKYLSIYKQTFDKAVVESDQEPVARLVGDDSELDGAMATLANIIAQTNDQHLLMTLLKADSNARNYLLTGQTQFRDHYNNAVNDLSASASGEEEIDGGVKETLLAALMNYKNAVNDYSESGGNADELFADTTIAAHATLFPLPTLTDRFKAQQAEIYRQFIYILAGVAIALVLIFLVVIYQLRRAQDEANKTLEERLAAQERAELENDRLNDSVIEILEAVNELSKRDLTVRAPVTEDIIGTVSDSINALTEETSRVLLGVTQIAGRVARVSDTVRDQAEQVSETAREERDNVQEMVDQLFIATQTMNQMAALAEQSNDSAAQATEATDGALQTVTDTVVGMESIRQTISETEKRIKRLGERSQEISGIVNLINTISERTHVLALNASMQAAVAGEAGRGFAVVAQEVQQLAESSRHATDQIATLVNNIQIETNETINTVNSTINQVVEGSDQAQKAGKQMRRTQQITEQLVAHVQSIAEASLKQKSMSAVLLEAVQKIGESTEKTAAQLVAQNAETEQLREAAKELVESVNVFKLPDLETEQG